MRTWLLDATAEIWRTFRTEFARLWRYRRSGILYPSRSTRIRATRSVREQALDHILHDIWRDMLGFAGIEIHRRILGLAHNAEFESIADEELRAACERPALEFGRHLVVNRRRIASLDEVHALARLLAEGMRR